MWRPPKIELGGWLYWFVHTFSSSATLRLCLRNVRIKLDLLSTSKRCSTSIGLQFKNTFLHLVQEFGIRFPKHGNVWGSEFKLIPLCWLRLYIMCSSLGVNQLSWTWIWSFHTKSSILPSNMFTNNQTLVKPTYLTFKTLFEAKNMYQLRNNEFSVWVKLVKKLFNQWKGEL
jgi:hypothetical protein